MNIIYERQALDTIASLLPPGYVKIVPFSVQKDVSFEFKGVTVKMSKIRYNEALDCYMFDLAWGSVNKIYGIPIRAGLDILQQYKTPLPNMIAANSRFPGENITSWRSMNLFVIDTSVLEHG